MYLYGDDFDRLKKTVKSDPDRKLVLLLYGDIIKRLESKWKLTTFDKFCVLYLAAKFWLPESIIQSLVINDRDKKSSYIIANEVRILKALNWDLKWLKRN